MAPLLKFTSGRRVEERVEAEGGVGGVEAGLAAVTDHRVLPHDRVALGLPRAVVLRPALQQLRVERADRQALELQRRQALVHRAQLRRHPREQLLAACQRRAGEPAGRTPRRAVDERAARAHEPAVVDLEELVRVARVGDERVLIRDAGRSGAPDRCRPSSCPSTTRRRRSRGRRRARWRCCPSRRTSTNRRRRRCPGFLRACDEVVVPALARAVVERRRSVDPPCSSWSGRPSRRPSWPSARHPSGRHGWSGRPMHPRPGTAASCRLSPSRRARAARS